MYCHDTISVAPIISKKRLEMSGNYMVSVKERWEMVLREESVWGLLEIMYDPFFLWKLAKEN